MPRPQHILDELLSRIEPASEAAAELARGRVTDAVPDDVARTLGPMAATLAGAQHSSTIRAAQRTVLVCGADRDGEESCRDDLIAVAAGTAPVCGAARAAGAAVVAIDAGVRGAEDLPDAVLSFRIGDGARDFHAGPAMTDDDARSALQTGFALVFSLADTGLDVLGVGAIDQVSIDSSIAVIDRIGAGGDPIETLAAVGGFDIGVIAGAIAGAASIRVPVIIDGIVTAAAAAVACGLCEPVRGYLVAARAGQLQAHREGLARLGVSPLFPQGVSRGDGAGAALAMPVIASAAEVLRQIR